MKKIVCFLSVLCVFVIAVTCSAEESFVPEDGLYTIGVQSSSRMFKIVNCVLHVSDGQMTAVITLSSDGYGYVYPGTAQEATDANVETWIPYVEDWEGAYTYALPITALDEELAVAGYSRRYEKWYDRTLVFHSNTISGYDAIAPDGVYAGLLSSDDAGLDGKECLLTAKDGMMTVETADGLSISLASLDKKQPVDETCWIMVETRSLTEYRVQASDGVYQADVTTDSSLLRFESCILKVESGRMTAILKAKNNNFDYLYVGTAADAAQNEADWIPAIPDAEGAYTYIVEISSLDNEIQIATYSGKKKMWYDRTIFIDSASLASEGDN